MESGKLNERITIKSHDGQTSYDVWCNVIPVTTREQLRNSTVLANNLLTLQIRYLKDINNTFKVVYQGYEYDIVKSRRSCRRRQREPHQYPARYGH